MAALDTMTDIALIEIWEGCRSLPWRQKRDIHDELAARIKAAGILHHAGRAYYPTDDGSFRHETTYTMSHRRPLPVLDEHRAE